MAGATSLAAAANLAGKSSVRVVVIGDPGTGKSSLIVALATEQFPENVPRVMPPTRLPADYFPDRVPITIIDTSSRYSDLVPLLPLISDSLDLDGMDEYLGLS
jgi:mitochondrial Rho GTPase 1